MKFIDEVNISVASGNGGPGCVSFRREAMMPRGGPDGGDGGKGGDVIFRVNPQLHSLLDLRFKKKYQAEHGKAGAGSLCKGADGEDLVIFVPPGTVIKSEDDQLLADLGKGEQVILLAGGRGGKGNHFFKNSVNQAPTHAQPGEKGSSLSLHIELKLLADVGLVGFPNAGKSTLISKISAARPKIADYPFTTLTPNLGVVRVDEERSFVVADIPGLVEGAHQGVGLGTQFLRHIERTKVFVHLIDGSEFNPRDPWEDYTIINKELQSYDALHVDSAGFSPLAGRTQLVVLSKADAISAERREELVAEFARHEVELFTISAATGEGIRPLIYKLSDLIFKKPSNKEVSI